MAIRVDPELRLSIGSSSGDGNSNVRSNKAKLNRVQSLLRNCTAYQQQNQQQMTIFYNGRVCVCDATEIKARAIISMAKGEMDIDMMKKNQLQEESVGSAQPQPPSPSPQAMPQLLNPGLSMKRSLQRFLQKRKARMNDVSPYSQRHQSSSPIKSKLQA